MGEDNEISFTGTLYYQIKLKWYEKIWYFITRKKNEPKPLGIGIVRMGGKDNENNDKSTYER